MADVEIIDAEALGWETHPRAGGLRRKTLLQSEGGVSFFLVRAEEGTEVAEHVHEEEEDIAYVLSGEALLSIRGEVIPVKAGMLIRIPRGVPHRVFDCRGDFRVLNLFLPSPRRGEIP